MSVYYSIDTGDGHQLTTGLSEVVARRVAQRMANERGESVFLYASDASPDEPSEEVKPGAQ